MLGFQSDYRRGARLHRALDRASRGALSVCCRHRISWNLGGAQGPAAARGAQLGGFVLPRRNRSRLDFPVARRAAFRTCPRAGAADRICGASEPQWLEEFFLWRHRGDTHRATDAPGKPISWPRCGGNTLPPVPSPWTRGRMRDRERYQPGAARRPMGRSGPSQAGVVDTSQPQPTSSAGGHRSGSCVSIGQRTREESSALDGRGGIRMAVAAGYGTVEAVAARFDRRSVVHLSGARGNRGSSLSPEDAGGWRGLLIFLRPGFSSNASKRKQTLFARRSRGCRS
jgi:hypothetical protein